MGSVPTKSITESLGRRLRRKTPQALPVSQMMIPLSGCVRCFRCSGVILFDDLFSGRVCRVGEAWADGGASLLLGYFSKP